MRIGVATCAAAALALTGCRGGPIAAPPSSASAASEGEASAVYAAVLRDVVRDSDTTRYVVDPEWSGPRKGRMPRNLAADLPIEWFGHADLPAHGRDDPGILWDAFHRRYGHSVGWTSFGSIRFSRDGGAASVRVVHSYGGLSGTEWFVSLVKQEGRWRVARKAVGARA
jgi:hypothetical protein